MRNFSLARKIFIILAILVTGQELPTAKAQDTVVAGEQQKSSSSPIKHIAQTNTSTRTDKLYSLQHLKLPSWITNVPDDNEMPSSPTMHALPRTDPKGKTFTSGCGIQLGPFKSTRFEGLNDDKSSYSIPLKVSADGCISLLSADDKAFHVKIDAKGAIDDFHTTFNYFGRADCPKPSSVSALNQAQGAYAYFLSDITIATDPKPNGLNYAMTLTGRLSGSPCGDLVKFGVALDFTHTHFIADVKIPLLFDAAALSIKPGSATTKFIQSEPFGGQQSKTETLWTLTNAQHFETVQKEITATVQQALTARLDVSRPENKLLAAYLDVGRFIPKDKFTNVQVKTTKLSTDNGSVRLEVSLTGDVPRSYLDPYMNAPLANYINDRIYTLGLK
jgi:hypothetical protein